MVNLSTHVWLHPCKHFNGLNRSQSLPHMGNNIKIDSFPHRTNINMPMYLELFWFVLLIMPIDGNSIFLPLIWLCQNEWCLHHLHSLVKLAIYQCHCQLLHSICFSPRNLISLKGQALDWPHSNGLPSAYGLKRNAFHMSIPWQSMISFLSVSTHQTPVIW